MNRTLVALGLGAAAYFLTDQVVAGLFVAAAVFWLGRHTFRRPTFISEGRAHTTPRAQPDAPGIVVVCKQVTPLRQEWISLKTGRLFDVLSHHGPPAPKSGDHGQVVMSGSSYRIRPLARLE